MHAKNAQQLYHLVAQSDMPRFRCKITLRPSDLGQIKLISPCLVCKKRVNVFFHRMGGGLNQAMPSIQHSAREHTRCSLESSSKELLNGLFELVEMSCGYLAELRTICILQRFVESLKLQNFIVLQRLRINNSYQLILVKKITNIISMQLFALQNMVIQRKSVAFFILEYIFIVYKKGDQCNWERNM